MNKALNYSANEILEQLDECAEEYTFPMLDNGYVYPIDSRITAYRDPKRWAIIIEVVGFNYRGGGHNGISNCLHVFGNCFDYAPGTHDDNFINMTADSEEGETFDAEYAEHLNPKVGTMLLRDAKIAVNHNPKFYKGKGIDLIDAPEIKVWEFLRGLTPEYRLELLASEEELRERIPTDLPEFIRLDEWHHPDLISDEKPSQNETFKMLALALVSGDVTKFKPTQKPNNHWSNWPDGGTL